MSQNTIVEGTTPTPPSRKMLLLITASGFLAAAIIVVLFVLPVEYHMDPTGFGRMSGLDRLAAPTVVTLSAPAKSNTASGVQSPTLFYTTAYRSDVIDIPLKSGDEGVEASELEYKVRMKAGDSLVYSWNVTGQPNPELFYYDFHSETPAGTGGAAKVVEYRQATGLQSNGTLIAPISGVHGWYLQNQSSKPVVVHLKLSGFYELVPPGEYGNLAGIRARDAKN
jgi:hypothetical protein